VSLEQYQARHNNHIAAAGNSSASLDPHQQPHDANDLLIKGAGLAAAGRELGLSEEETLAAVSRQFRKQEVAPPVSGRERVRSGISERRAKRAKRESEWAQKRASLGVWGDGELDGVGYEDMSETERAFGQDQSDYQNFRADDTGFTADEETGLIRRETFGESRGEFVDMAPKSALRDALTQLQAGTAQYGYDAFPGSADVAGRLEADIAPDRGADASLGAEAVIASRSPRSDEEITRIAERRLRQEFEGSDRSGSVVRSMPIDARDQRKAQIMADLAGQRFDPEVQEYNNYQATAEADGYARDSYTVNGPGAMADESIGRIKEIRSLGKVGETAHVVSTANDAIQGQATQRADGVYLNPQTGDPVARQGPELPGISVGDNIPNNGSSSNNLNAPQTAREWVTQAIPDYRESSSSFGAFPQVDITLQTTNFANKVRDYGEKNNIPELTQVSGNIRSIDELERVVQFIAAKRVAAGQGLTIPNPDIAGASLPAGRNTTGGVMNALNIQLGEQQQLANAMFQLDAAQRSSVNENPTGTYLSRLTKQGPQPMGQGGENLTRENFPQVTEDTAESLIAGQRRKRTGQTTFDAREAVNNKEGGARIAQIPKGNTIGVRNEDTGAIERKTVVNELAALSGGPSVQKPYIGQVAGEKPRVNRRKPGRMGSGNELQANIQRQAESRAKGKPLDQERVDANITKARLSEEREKRDSVRRDEQKDLIRSFTPANLRQRGRYS
tara:strand:+ start:2149 stop:4344 length:2196 start_codon:yes stop_codon:yes gene_type:complete